jgi:hypothetical protein
LGYSRLGVIGNNDEMQASRCGARGGRVVAEASKRWHYIGGPFCVVGIADKEADARAIYPGRVDRRRLGEDDVGIAGDCEVSDGA